MLMPDERCAEMRIRPDELSDLEKKLMRAMGLKDVSELDELLAAPTSEWAADHSELPDEEFDRADRINEEADRHWEALQRFSALSEINNLN